MHSNFTLKPIWNIFFKLKLNLKIKCTILLLLLLFRAAVLQSEVRVSLVSLTRKDTRRYSGKKG